MSPCMLTKFNTWIFSERVQTRCSSSSPGLYRHYHTLGKERIYFIAFGYLTKLKMNTCLSINYSLHHFQTCNKVNAYMIKQHTDNYIHTSPEQTVYSSLFSTVYFHQTVSVCLILLLFFFLHVHLLCPRKIVGGWSKCNWDSDRHCVGLAHLPYLPCI